MGEHLRVDRQEVLTNSDNRTSGQSLASLPQVADGIDIGGSWFEAHRSLASRSQVPGRGHAEHGTDSETDSLDYLPDQSGAVAPLRDDVGDNAPDYTDLMLDADPYTDGVQRPVAVTIVPGPKLSVIKNTSIQIPFDGATYPGTGPLYLPDPMFTWSLPADPTRVRTRVYLSRVAATFASVQMMYWFAVSSDSGASWAQIMGNTTPGNVVTSEVLEFQGGNPLWFSPVRMNPYDPTKVNTWQLIVVVETETVANVNPAV